MCGFDVKLGTIPIALEAAHIKWKSHGGPNQAVNGLALCILHHKLFDLGAFTLSKQLQILVSDDVHGTKGFKECLMDFHGQTINLPQGVPIIQMGSSSTGTSEMCLQEITGNYNWWSVQSKLIVLFLYFSRNLTKKGISLRLSETPEEDNSYEEEIYRESK